MQSGQGAPLLFHAKSPGSRLPEALVTCCRVAGQAGRVLGCSTGPQVVSPVFAPQPALDPLFMCCWWWLHDETLVGGDRGGGEGSVAQKVAGQGQGDAYLAGGGGLVCLAAD